MVERQEQSILCESIDKISGNAELESQLASVKETVEDGLSFAVCVRPELIDSRITLDV